jgi:flagellar L-ring protein precursor FlgH
MQHMRVILVIVLAALTHFQCAATSLWRNSSGNLATEYRPELKLGDIILVTISEQAEAQQNSKTEIKDEATAQNNMLTGLTNVFRLSHFTDAANLLNRIATNLSDTSHQSQMKGDDKVTANTSFSTYLSVCIKRALPNGNFYVEGEKSLLINSESHRIKIAGMIRPSDVINNTIESNKIADAEISFVGSGAMDGTRKPGFLQRLYNILF